MQVSIPIFDLVRLLSVAQCSMYLTCFVAQTHRDDIECLAYTLIDCLRDLPWRRITVAPISILRIGEGEEAVMDIRTTMCGLNWLVLDFPCPCTGGEEFDYQRRLRVILSKGDI